MSYVELSSQQPRYPAARYTGETGEISARFRPADTAPDVAPGSGTHIHYLANNASTNGDFGLYRVEIGPEGGGASPHFHKTISESFFVLSGTLNVFDGERWIDATAGDFLYVPAGGLHAFRNIASEPTSFLMLFAPGADREGYFEGLAGLAELTEEQRTEFFHRHDNYFVNTRQRE